MTDIDAIEQYKKSAGDSWDTANKLFVDKKYHHGLFFVHLAVEKLLKALHQKNKGQPALPLHNLTRLAELSGFPIDETTKGQLNEISTFNLSARYDDYKLSFYKKATKDYSEIWMKVADLIYNQLLNQLK